MSFLNFRKDQYPVLIANLIALAIFSYVFAIRRDYEFLGYIGVILLVIIFINASNKRANYSNGLSWILSIWGWMHLAGSAVYLNGLKLYEIIVIPIYIPYGILRYDQVVHAIGMVAATIGIYYLYKAVLKPEIATNWKIMTLILLASGLGVGVGNEILEFIVTIIIPENGVGDYRNTSLDHVSNLIGVLAAIIYLRSRALNERKEIKNEVFRD